MTSESEERQAHETWMESFWSGDGCPKCGEVGEDIGRIHKTLGGSLSCLRRQAEVLGADDMVAQIDMTKDWVALKRDQALGLPTPGLDFDAPQA